MISQDVVLVRYGEITLKDSWTRQSWERILAGNIAFYLQKAGVEYRSERGEGRIFIFTSDPRASEIISRVFGVVSTSPAFTVPSNLEEIARAAVEAVRRGHVIVTPTVRYRLAAGVLRLAPRSLVRRFAGPGLSGRD